MTQYFILPGYGNSNEDHWQSHFERTLPNAKRIEQKSWEEPICEDWVTAIEEALQGHDVSKVVVVAHSLGCVALAHWAAKYGKVLKGAFLVAPPDIENPCQDIPVQSFLPIPKEDLPFKTLVVASSNDHWASVKRSIHFAFNWGSEIIMIGEAGHINTSSGYGKWEKGLELLKGL